MKKFNICLTLSLFGILFPYCGATAIAQQAQGSGPAPGLLSNAVPGQSIFSQQSDISETDQRLDNILGTPSYSCEHVIARLQESQWRQSSQMKESDVSGEILLPGLSAPLKPGDLQLLGVHLMPEATSPQGHCFLVTLQNASQIPIGNFELTLVAVSGVIQVHSPNATGPVRQIEAGATVQIQLRLQSCDFDTIIVSADSFDELMECNESNNILIIPRSQIPLFVVQPVIEANSDVALPLAPPVTGGATPIPESLPQPGDPSMLKPSLLEQLDVDSLQPGESAPVSP